MQPTLETLNHSYHCPCPLFCFLWYTNTRPSRHLRKCEGFFARRRRCLAALQNTADTVWFIRNLWTFAMQQIHSFLNYSQYKSDLLLYSILEAYCYFHPKQIYNRLWEISEIVHPWKNFFTTRSVNQTCFYIPYKLTPATATAQFFTFQKPISKFDRLWEMIILCMYFGKSAPKENQEN